MEYGQTEARVGGRPFGTEDSFVGREWHWDKETPARAGGHGHQNYEEEKVRLLDIKRSDATQKKLSVAPEK